MAFHSLCSYKDYIFSNNFIHVKVGKLENHNMRLIAEKDVHELEHELKYEYPGGSIVSSCALSLMTVTLNMRVCNHILSTREIVYQRDGFTRELLNFDNELLADNQHTQREQNHGHSAHNQAKVQRHASKANVCISDLIFLKCDSNKYIAYNKYIVTSRCL